MKYVGSKNRLAKELVPIIQSYITEDTVRYVEPFVGGANIIDKIKAKHKVGFDIHEELIALLNYCKYSEKPLPESISKEVYNDVKENPEKYSKFYIGLVGFCGSYNAKYFGGYAGECRTKEGIRYYDKEAIRNLEKQRKNLKDIFFSSESFETIFLGINNVFYCDIPYRNTTKYKTEEFDYEKFYKWAIEASKYNTVLISEYDMPEEFECIWEKPHKTSLDKNDNKKPRVEKLFIVKGETND